MAVSYQGGGPYQNGGFYQGAADLPEWRFLPGWRTVPGIPSDLSPSPGEFPPRVDRRHSRIAGGSSLFCLLAMAVLQRDIDAGLCEWGVDHLSLLGHCLDAGCSLNLIEGSG